MTFIAIILFMDNNNFTNLPQQLITPIKPPTKNKLLIFIGLIFIVVISVILVKLFLYPSFIPQLKISTFISPTPTSTPPSPTPLVNWDEQLVIKAWKENNNSYQLIGYKHKGGYVGINKNKKMYIDFSKLPKMEAIESILLNDQEKTLYVLESNTIEQNNVIDAISILNKVSLPSFKIEKIGEFTGFMTGGGNMLIGDMGNDQLLINKSSGGACSFNSDIFIFNILTKEQQDLKKTEYVFCNPTDKGGEHLVGFHKKKLIYASVDRINKNNNSLYFFDPISQKQEVVLNNKQEVILSSPDFSQIYPWDSMFKIIRLDVENPDQLIFSNNNGTDYYFDLNKKQIVSPQIHKSDS